jgi:hypothetical protein
MLLLRGGGAPGMGPCCCAAWLVEAADLRFGRLRSIGASYGELYPPLFLSAKLCGVVTTAGFAAGGA